MNKDSEEQRKYKIKTIKRNEKEEVLLLDKVPDELLSEIIKMCKIMGNVSIRIKPSDIERLDRLGIDIASTGIDMYYFCETVAEAPVRMLTSHRIKGILVGSRGNDCARKMDTLKYSVIRYNLERIVYDLENKSDKEKFKTIYTRLAYIINYDYDATIDGSKYATENIETARNLENAVLLNTCVCQGFSEVLRQTLSLVGIESEICYSIDGKDGTSHTYNLVKIDDKWFNTDLTWDYSDIRKGRRPKYCLKSDKDFRKCKQDEKPFHIPCDKNVHECNKSIELYPELRSYAKKKSRRKNKTSIFERIYFAIKGRRKIEQQEKIFTTSKREFKDNIKVNMDIDSRADMNKREIDEFNMRSNNEEKTNGTNNSPREK